MLVCIIIVGVVVLASTQTCKCFVTVLWVLQYYTQIVSTISGVGWGWYGPNILYTQTVPLEVCVQYYSRTGSSGVSPRMNHFD